MVVPQVQSPPVRSSDGDLACQHHVDPADLCSRPDDVHVIARPKGHSELIEETRRSEVDISVAAVELRFQVNAFNLFNVLQLQPITNGNANPGANIQSATFGQAQGADAGRVLEFVARIQF